MGVTTNESPPIAIDARRRASALGARRCARERSERAFASTFFRRACGRRARDGVRDRRAGRLEARGASHRWRERASARGRARGRDAGTTGVNSDFDFKTRIFVVRMIEWCVKGPRRAARRRASTRRRNEARLRERARETRRAYAHHVLGFLKASSASASREPAAGAWSYCHSQ